MVPRKIDPRVAGIVIALSLVGAFTILGDRVAFIREPKNFAEIVLALPTSISFMVFGSRFYSNIAAALFWTGLVLAIGFYLYGVVVRKVIEPMVIKNMIETKRREKKLLNQYGDDTL